MLFAEKFVFKKGCYFLISLEKTDNKKKLDSRGNDLIIGKLKNAEKKKNKFILFDDGEKFNDMKSSYQDLRVEHGAFIFTYIPSNVGNIRQITVILPKVEIAKSWDK